MSPFIGRADELQRLNDHLMAVVRTGRGRLLTVRGRRQVGKSALLTRFADAAAAPSIYFTALQSASTTVHLTDFAAAAQAASPRISGVDLFDEPPVSWSDAFQRVATLARQPLIVIIDEFPWAAASDATLESRLQTAWDRTLQTLPVLLVLVGSDLAVMERTVAHDAPLYGRARPFMVEALDVADTHAALGSPAMDSIDSYLVTGGYPRLVTAAAEAGGATELVAAAMTDALSELVVTAQLSLDAELPRDLPARAVLEAIGHESRGPAVLGSIVDRLPASGGTAKAQVSRAIEVLQAKRLVAIESPVGAPAASRLRRYRVADPYLRFWLRFLATGLSDMERGRGDLVHAHFLKGWQSWRGRAVEPIVRDRLWRAAPDIPALASAETIGGWWDRVGRHEIDIATTGGGHVTSVGTIKWRATSPVDRREMQALVEASATIAHGSTPALIAVCPAGAHDGVADLVWTADDVVARHTTSLNAPPLPGAPMRSDEAGNA